MDYLNAWNLKLVNLGDVWFAEWFLKECNLSKELEYGGIGMECYQVWPTVWLTGNGMESVKGIGICMLLIF